MLRWLMWLGFLAFLNGASPSLLMAQRLVSLAPSLTETACALDLCGKLVGVTEYCVVPAEARRIPKVGGYLEPNLEVILGMRPDLVLAVPEQQRVIEQLRKLGMRVEVLRNYTVADIHTTIDQIGALCDRKNQADTLNKNLRRSERELAVKRERTPRCLMVLGHAGGAGSIKDIFVVGRKGFLSDILALAGAVNAYPKDEPYFPRLDREGLLGLDPDIVVELIPQTEMSDSALAERKAEWMKIKQLKAVRAGAVFFIHRDEVLQPGPRYLLTLRQLSGFLDGI